MTKRQTLSLLIALLMTLFVLPVIAQESTGDTFPLTVRHKYGTTTITEAPTRVVTLGFTDQDALLALGITPVAVRYWYGDETNAVFPWAQDEVEGEQPVVLNMPTLNYEAILALKPDLIIAIYSGITEDDYKALSQIAPTVPQLAEYTDYGMPWQATTKLVGEAVGKSTEADALISDTEALLTTAREENPAFTGKSVAVVYPYKAGSYGFYTAQDPRGRFFTDLGFVIPEDLLDIAGDTYYADISAERIDLLDRDLIVVVGLQFVEGGQEEIESDPLLNQLKAVKEGRILYVAGDFDDAIQFNTVLSLPYLLEKIIPDLQAIFGSTDAAQSTTTCEAGFHLFDHELLATDPVCIPDNPQRIVAIDAYSLETLLALDVTPIGSAVVGSFAVEFPEVGDKVAGITDLGAPVNMETLVALDPDLIITIQPWVSETYDKVAEIAPVVSINFDDLPWDGLLSIVAGAVNKADVVESYIDTYNQRVETLRDTIVETSSESTLSIVQLYNNVLNIYPIESSFPNLFPTVGVTGSVKQNEAIGTEWRLEISKEQLDLLDTDYVFLVVYATNDEDKAANETMVATLESDPLWQTLPVVKAGNVHVVNFYWNAGGIMAEHKRLDDLFQYVAGVNPADVSPNPFIPAQLEATPEATEAN